ncbi:MAG: hypothetical protein WEC75_02380 [Dehalococcoidia bacterium]
MAIVATHPSFYAPAESRALGRSLASALAAAARHLPLALVVGLVVGIHIPTLNYYFFGDDFLVLGDIQSRSFGRYVSDTVLLRDLTPNWRPLTMLIYWGEFKLFGFDAMAWRIVNLSVHVATTVMLYALVLSMTRRVFVASAAALIFAVSASAVHTVTYITAFPHLLSELLLISSIFALHRYVESGERRAGWYWLSLLLYVAGFLANEGGVVIVAALFVYFAGASLWKRRDVLDFALKMTPFALAAAFLVGGLGGCGCQGVDDDYYSVGWHIPQETWVYLSRLAFPVGAIALRPSAMEWAWGSVVAGFALFFLVRGPNIARFAAVGMVLALMPYAPGKIWTATRYTYMALPFFAILVAVAAGFVHHHLVRLNRPLAHVLAAAALFAVGGLYAWQTTHQTQPFLEETARWRLLTDELRANYASLPEGSTLYVLDDEGMWSNAYWQPTWLKSVGRALYGDGVTVQAIPTWEYERRQDSLDGPVYLVRLKDGRLEPVTRETATAISQQE